MNSSVGERRKHDRDADHEKRKPAGERVPDAIDAALRANSLAQAAPRLSATTTLVSSLDTEVVIPNRTKNRTDRRLVSAARDAHDLENYCFRLFASLESDRLMRFQSLVPPGAIADEARTVLSVASRI